MKLLKIGSVAIPQHAALDLEQTYERLGDSPPLRTANGTGIKQIAWSKIRTVISGGGWSPPGLDALDYTQQHAVACIAPRAVNADSSREAVLPAARRSDAGHLPFGFAFMPDGVRVETACVVIADTATLDAVTDAIAYQALYYPLLTCWLQRPTESVQRADASYRWELVAEEV